MLTIMRLINAGSQRPLSDAALERSFTKWWPEFEEPFGKIKFNEPDQGKKKQATKDDLSGPLADVLDEVLSEVRALRSQVKPKLSDSGRYMFPPVPSEAREIDEEIWNSVIAKSTRLRLNAAIKAAEHATTVRKASKGDPIDGLRRPKLESEEEADD